jgi:octaprenyl-diphosphate synthase
MIRPALLLLSGVCFGPVTDDHIRVAAMVEMVHNATLLHDDVIDDGTRRRGRPTVNSLWGNESAVLLGDFVLSQVFKMGASLEPATARLVAQTAARVCEGELRQVMQRHNWQITEAQYIDIITEKSAAFFSGCCELGAMLGGARPHDVEAMTRFGTCAGIAFQITDDLLDLAGDENTTGKTGRSDLATHKPTLAVIHLLENTGPSERNDVLAMLDAAAESSGPLLEMLTRKGSLDYARARAEDYVAQAHAALDGIGSDDGRDALIAAARFMADRIA